VAVADAVAAVAAEEVAAVEDRLFGGVHTMNAIPAARRARSSGIALTFAFALILATPVFAQNPAPAAGAGQSTYASPEEAVSTLKAAVAAGDRSALPKLFGPSSAEFSSGDAVADKAAIALFAKRLAKQSHLVKRADGAVVLYLGAENWPFPVPIVKAGDRWFFDGNAGLDEMSGRRIGANELHTVKVCREYVRAQREYADDDRDGDEVMEFAQRFSSKPGQKDGLYWPTAEGEDESPFGPLVAYAESENYNSANGPQPFHGYIFKIVARQGAAAPGGAYGYVINGNMIGGFALVAYPADWGSSGLTTFIVNQQGKVFEKDLGPRTSAIAAGMRVYNPDSTWTAVDED